MITYDFPLKPDNQQKQGRVLSGSVDNVFRNARELQHGIWIGCVIAEAQLVFPNLKTFMLLTCLTVHCINQKIKQSVHQYI